MDLLDGFSNPWEHVRLLSDRDRNQAMVEVLERHAQGARVVEVGCGTGVLSCIAARLGATRVYAVEPTPMWEAARELVAVNGLQDVVEVIEGRIQDVSPRPVELAFSELLNADPYREDLLDAMDGVRPWLVSGGVMAPRRIQVFVALVRAPRAADEHEEAMSELARLGVIYDLDLRPTQRRLVCEEPYNFVSQRMWPVTSTARVHDLPLGGGARPESVVDVDLVAEQTTEIGGAVFWFEATLDDHTTLSNAPDGGHWGQLVCGWSRAVSVEEGQALRLRVTVTPDGLDARLVTRR